uniref:Uncharacterized protein n=1 Tax=Biomphalaria glabrata TaxID=6526 RepID=A0A2C9M442_BIOGL
MSSFSFFVYDWDGTNTINDDFLGSVHFRMSESQPEVIKRTLTLGYNKPDEGFSEDKKCGQITFTAVFRPVESVSKSEKFHQLMKSYKPNDYLYKEDLMSPSTMVIILIAKACTLYMLLQLYLYHFNIFVNFQCL